MAPAERIGAVADVSEPELLGEPGGEPVEIVPADPAWKAEFASWKRQIKAALGPLAVRIEHVGSTAVADLPAKPVLDVQVSVPDQAALEAEAYVEPLEALGLSLRGREPGHRFLRPRPDRGEPRTVHVHVCVAGSPWERDHLLFRDYLRAHPEHRKAYADLKADLAARFRDERPAYNEGKTSFVDGTLWLADEWAVATGWKG